jgi:hypothetical protein
MRRVLAAEFAELLELQLVRGLLLVLGRGVVLPFALGAIQTDDNAHTVLLLSGTVTRHLPSYRPVARSVFGSGLFSETYAKVTVCFFQTGGGNLATPAPWRKLKTDY